MPDTAGPGGGGGDAVVAAAGYDAVLGPNGARRLNEWVQAGGTLIGLGSGAVAYLADPKTGLLAISQESAARPVDPAANTSATAAAPTASASVPGKLLAIEQDFEKAIQPDTELPDSLHGVLIRAKVNTEHWVTAGLPDTVSVLASGRAIFTPIKLDKGVNAPRSRGPTNSWPADTSGSKTGNSSPTNRS